MPMNELTKTKLFNLLADISQVTNERMKSAYEDFVTEVITLNQSERDYQTVFRSLNLTPIELQSLRTQTLYGQREKCFRKSV